jgi:hypothetical protein
MLPKISRYSTAITLMMRVWEPSRSMPCAVCVCVRGILKDLCGEGKGQLQGGSARIALHRLFGVRTMEDSEELDRGRQLRMTRLVEQAVHRGAQGEPEERLSAGRFRGGDPGKRDGRDDGASECAEWSQVDVDCAQVGSTGAHGSRRPTRAPPEGPTSSRKQGPSRQESRGTRAGEMDGRS